MANPIHYFHVGKGPDSSGSHSQRSGKIGQGVGIVYERVGVHTASDGYHRKAQVEVYPVAHPLEVEVRHHVDATHLEEEHEQAEDAGGQ